LKVASVLGVVASLIAILSFFWGIEKFSDFFQDKPSTMLEKKVEVKKKVVNENSDSMLDTIIDILSFGSMARRHAKQIMEKENAKLLATRKKTASPDGKKIAALYGPSNIWICNARAEDCKSYELYSSLSVRFGSNKEPIKNLTWVGNDTLRVSMDCQPEYRSSDECRLDNFSLANMVPGLFNLKIDNNGFIISAEKYR
jgi:hypothetical protein